MQLGLDFNGLQEIENPEKGSIFDIIIERPIK